MPSNPMRFPTHPNGATNAERYFNSTIGNPRSSSATPRCPGAGWPFAQLLARRRKGWPSTGAGANGHAVGGLERVVDPDLDR